VFAADAYVSNKITKLLIKFM